MARIAKPERRDYHSDLRADQLNQTRERILDAAVRVMSRGITSLSVPGVAKEAGVSVPTVYRHFATKADLLSAVYPHVARRAGLDRMPDPRNLDELRDGIRAVFDRVDALDDLARAAMASPASSEVRQATMPGRVARLSRLADSIAPQLARGDRDRITRLLAVLTASSSLRMLRDHLGRSVDQAADDIDWTIRAAIAASRRREG